MTSKIKVDPTIPQVGQAVQYTGRDGIPFAATILMTEATYQEARDHSGTAKPSDSTSVTLSYERPFSGRRVVRHNVPLSGSPAHKDLVAKDQAYQEHLAMLEQAAAEDLSSGELNDEGDLPITPDETDTETPQAPEKVTVRSWNPIPA